MDNVQTLNGESNMAHSEGQPAAFGFVSVHSPYRKLKGKLAKKSVRAKNTEFLKISTQVSGFGGFGFWVFCEINFKEGPEILFSIQQQL